MKQKLNELEHGKLPPQDVDIEMAVLGAILIDKKAIIKIRSLLTKESFYKESHGKIFNAAILLNEKNNSIDILTVINKLKELGELDIVGGAYYVSQLTNRVASAANIEQHIQILKMHEMKRKQIRLGSEIITEAYDQTVSATDTNEKLSLIVSEMLRSLDNTEDKSISDLILEALKDVEKAKKQKGITGIPSGFSELDKVTHGFQNSDLIYIAARPSMGKTAVALKIARNVSINHGKHVAFFSLEMNSVKLVTRLLSSESAYDINQLQTGNLDANDFIRLNKDIKKLAESNLYFFDRIKNIYSIKNKCLDLHINGKLDLIIIDYLQLISHSKFEKNREQEVSQISRELKQLALDLNIPIICLSQLSREVEKRADKKPQLSDLRDSGSIEQDADLVIFPFRPTYYKIPDSPEDLALLLIRKHRNGNLATIKLKCNLAKMDFKDWKENEETNTDLPF